MSKKWQVAVIGIVMVSMMISSGCVAMSRGQIENYREIQTLGLPINPMGVPAKNAVAAGVLALVVPGAGNAYLAIGTDQSPQWTYAALNFLFCWTVIPYVASIPQVIIDTDTINKIEVIQYYHHTKEGKKLLEDARKSIETKPTAMMKE